MRDAGIELRRFLKEAEGGAYDLPPMQRALRAQPAFSVRLVDSLYREYRIGSMLIWEPPIGQRPAAGRYQSGQGRPRYWILDGQQRGASYVGAFGRRPSWIPEQRWIDMGGPSLEVAVHFTKSGGIRFRTHQPGRARHIRLADLVIDDGSSVRELFEEGGFAPTDTLVQAAMELRAQLLHYVLPVEWLSCDWPGAAENFIRRNPSLRPEERSLCSLSIACEELQREHIDRLILTARAAGFADALDRRRLSLILQDFLPREARRAQGRWAEPAAVSEAVRRLELSVGQAISFLHRHGITCDALLWSPPVVRVLCALFDRFPRAVSSPFTWRWLARAAAGQCYPGGAQSALPRQDVQAVLSAGSFQEAAAHLADRAGGEMVARVDAAELMLTRRPKRRLLGGAGTLYAMACAHRADGPVVDLFNPSRVFPDPGMRPRLLWPGMAEERSLAAWALLSEESAEQLEAGAGWSRAVFERMDVSPGILAAHQLEAPPGGGLGAGVEQQLKLRADAMTDTVNAFLSEVGPLAVPPREE